LGVSLQGLHGSGHNGWQITPPVGVFTQILHGSGHNGWQVTPPLEVFVNRMKNLPSDDLASV
jgi:hypothetical protein